MNRLLLTLFASLALSVSAFAAPASAGLLFAPEYGSDHVDIFDNAHPGGGLTAIAGSPFATPASGPDGWAMTPDGKYGIASFLFGGLRSFSIASGGAITPAQDVISWANNGAYSIAVSPNGKSAYLPTRHYPGSGAAGVRAYSIAADGALTEMAGSPYISLSDYFDVAVTPDGSKLFASDGSAIYHASVASNGVPSFGGADSVPGAQYLATSPDGRFLFENGHVSGTTGFSVFSIASDGALTQVGSTISIGPNTPRAPAISADGGFAYVPDGAVDKITTIRIGPDGTPSTVGTTDLADGDGIVATGDNKYLYVANQGSDYAIRVSPIGADGRPTGFTKSVDYMDGEPTRLFFRPGQGTKAQFTAAADAKPLTMDFDGSGTTSNLGGLGDFNWNFGDGAAASAAATTSQHKFAKAGVYDVTLTAADDAGCTTKFVYTGQSTMCNGDASSAKTVRVDTPPWITGLKVAPKILRKASKIRFKLTEKAKVSLRLEKPSPGRLVGTSCRKQTQANKKGKKCTRWTRFGRALKMTGRAGSNSLKITVPSGKAILPNGKYRVAATAIDGAGGKSPLATAKFKIKR